MYPAFFPIIVLAASLTTNPCDSVRPKPFKDRFLQVSGLDANPKRPERLIKRGDLYLAKNAAQSNTRKRLTDAGDFFSPVFADNDYVLALQGNSLVRVDLNAGLNSKPKWVADIAGAVRIAGFVKDEPAVLVVLAQQNTMFSPVLVCLDIPKVISFKAEDYPKSLATALPRLRRAERRYGNFILRDYQGDSDSYNVMRIDQNDTINLSKCDTGFDCTQGALSPNNKHIVFVETRQGH